MLTIGQFPFYESRRPLHIAARNRNVDVVRALGVWAARETNHRTASRLLGIANPPLHTQVVNEEDGTKPCDKPDDIAARWLERRDLPADWDVFPKHHRHCHRVAVNPEATEDDRPKHPSMRYAMAIVEPPEDPDDEEGGSAAGKALDASVRGPMPSPGFAIAGRLLDQRTHEPAPDGFNKLFLDAAERFKAAADEEGGVWMVEHDDEKKNVDGGAARNSEWAALGVRRAKERAAAAAAAEEKQEAEGRQRSQYDELKRLVAATEQALKDQEEQQDQKEEDVAGGAAEADAARLAAASTPPGPPGEEGTTCTALVKAELAALAADIAADAEAPKDHLRDATFTVADLDEPPPPIKDGQCRIEKDGTIHMKVGGAELFAVKRFDDKRKKKAKPPSCLHPPSAHVAGALQAVEPDAAPTAEELRRRDLREKWEESEQFRLGEVRRMRALGVISGPLTVDDDVRPMPPTYDGKPIKWGLGKHTPLPKDAKEAARTDLRLISIPSHARALMSAMERKEKEDAESARLMDVLRKVRQATEEAKRKDRQGGRVHRLVTDGDPFVLPCDFVCSCERRKIGKANGGGADGVLPLLGCFIAMVRDTKHEWIDPKDGRGVLRPSTLERLPPGSPAGLYPEATS